MKVIGTAGVKKRLAATLAPVGLLEERLSHKKIVEGMQALRQRVKPGRMSLRDMVNHERRF